MTLQFRAIPRLDTAPGKRMKVEVSKKKGLPASSKDFSLSIFQALGKFLYNKRITGAKEPEAATYK